jgi:hypothetical protein
VTDDPLTSDEPQSYCDWCFSPLTESSRRRSEALGLDGEFSRACTSCLDTQRYRQPPDGWAGSVEEWPFCDAFELSAEDLLVLKAALNEVLNGPTAIDEWEFHTRVGTDREAAKALLRRLSS